MLKYALFGIIVFLCYGYGKLVGTVALIIAICYTIYLNLPAFIALKGNKEINNKNLEQGYRYYKKAYETKRASADISLTYGMLALRCGKPDEAVTVFNELILNLKTKPNIKNQAKQYRTLAYYKLGQIEDALEEAEEIFDKYKNTTSYSLLCYLKLATNQPIEEVLSLCKEAYEYNDDDRDIVDNLAFAYIKNNEYEKAKELIDKMLEDYPTFMEAYYHGAIAYSKLGDTKKAKELLDLIDKNCTSTYLTTVSYDDINNLKNSLN